MVTAALILLFTGPWLVYLIVPVPDQLAEYRNYSMVAAFALLASLLPWLLWTPLLAYFVGMAHHHAMFWTDAVTFWKYAKAHTSGDPSRANQEIGAFLKIGGKAEEAEPYFVKAIELNPVLAPALENLANIYFGTGRLEQCYTLVQTMVERCPRYQSGWITRGLLMEHRGLFEDARLSFATALDLGPNAQATNHLGLLAFHEKRWPEAAEYFKAAQVMAPAEATYQYNEAMAYYAGGRKEEGDAIRARFNGIPIRLTPEMIQPQQSQQPQQQELQPA